MKIEIIREHKNNNKIYITEHCDARMRLRNITNKDVYNVIDNGKIIKQYKDDKPFPSCLVSGYSDGRPLHLVISDDGNTSYLITAYEPDKDLWIEDFTKKRGD